MAAKQLQGEWFRVTPERAKAIITEAVARVLAGHPLPPFTPKKTNLSIRGELPIWPYQVRAARAGLNWSIKELSEKSGVCTSTISCFEKGGDIMVTTIQTIKKTLEDAGIEFFPFGVRLKNGAGVRLTPEGHAEWLKRKTA